MRDILEPRTKLVFDIGMHTGADAAAYLQQGYRVVAVDANPELVELCRTRFRDELQSGAIQLVNAGIRAKSGEFTFYRNHTNSAWSSFLPERGRVGGQFEEIPVLCRTLGSLIAEFGMPYFIKTDLEGADLEVLEGLEPTQAPPYISCELSCTMALFNRLKDLGYDQFKFINGWHLSPGEPIFNHEYGWRLLRKLCVIFPFLRTVIRLFPYEAAPKEDFDVEVRASNGADSSGYVSGPFGEEARGRWLSAAEAEKRLAQLVRKYERYGYEEKFWWDVHARAAARPA